MSPIDRPRKRVQFFYELRVKIKHSLLVRMVVGATGSRATRLDTPPTCGNNPPFTAWS